MIYFIILVFLVIIIQLMRETAVSLQRSAALSDPTPCDSILSFRRFISSSISYGSQRRYHMYFYRSWIPLKYER